MYYNDARSAVTGAAPYWYGMYRFVLTFVVGASIVVSLIGRQQIAVSLDAEHTITEKISALLFLKKKEEEEAEERLKAEKEADEE